MHSTAFSRFIVYVLLWSSKVRLRSISISKTLLSVLASSSQNVSTSFTVSFPRYNIVLSFQLIQSANTKFQLKKAFSVLPHQQMCVIVKTKCLLQCYKTLKYAQNISETFISNSFISVIYIIYIIQKTVHLFAEQIIGLFSL